MTTARLFPRPACCGEGRALGTMGLLPKPCRAETPWLGKTQPGTPETPGPLLAPTPAQAHGKPSARHPLAPRGLLWPWSFSPGGDAAQSRQPVGAESICRPRAHPLPLLLQKNPGAGLAVFPERGEYNSKMLLRSYFCSQNLNKRL